MKMFSNLPDQVAKKLVQVTGIETTDNQEEATFFIYLFDEETPPKVKDPMTTIMVAWESEKIPSIVESLIELGVNDKNIFIVPRDQKISIRAIKERLNQIKQYVETIKLSQENTHKNGNNKSSIIKIVGFKGGLGRTMLATALTCYYSNCGEKVALIDLGEPPSSIYYMSKPPLAEKPGYSYAQTVLGDLYFPETDIEQLVSKLEEGYDKIIIDYPTSLPEAFFNVPGLTIIMIDYDLRTLELTREQLAKHELDSFLLVANRIPRVYTGTYSVVVLDILGTRPHIEIQADAEGCQSVLDRYSPVNDDQGSEIIAARVGQLATIINDPGVKNNAVKASA